MFGPQNNSHLDNWIEFQNNHLEIHDVLEKEVKDHREKLDSEQKKLETDTSGLTGAQGVDNLEHRVRYGQSRLRQHQILL